ncbi:MAG: export transporter ATP-binding protein [Pseudomonadota bacterium]
MTLSSVLLQAQGLSKSYRRRKVVDQVSLEVASGEVVGLLGLNGAGKTTCFYMLVGLIASDAGLISLEGKPIGHLPIHRRAKMGLSYLPQENSVFRQLTVEENILAVLQLNATNSREAQRDRLEHLLGELQIEHIRRQPAIALSGGERRRVEIARALATSPRFVLLDEPFAGVDPIAVIEIQRIVSFLRDRGIGVLITDHNVRETLGICDRAYILNDGKVLADGNPDVLIANEQVRKVYLGEHFKM